MRNGTHVKLACILALSIWALLGTVLFGQTVATILGTVKDESGAVLPGVMIEVKSVETGSVRTTITDEAGRYRVPQLSVGAYEIQASLPSFQTAVRSGINLTLGREAVVDFALKIGELSETVEVSGEAPLVETTNASLGALVDEVKIRELPINGRDYAALALLQPGVVEAVNQGRGLGFTGSGLKMSISGARPTQTIYMIDGMVLTNGFGFSPGSAAGIQAGVDALREFQVLTNSFSAEYGRAAGGIINAVSRSGSNDWHGSLFEFHRNSALDAKNYFDRKDAPIPAFIRNQFGATVGGPVTRDKTFFFFAYEGLRERLGTTNVTKVPDARAHQGYVFNPATGREEFVGVSPKIKPFLDLWPLPSPGGLNYGNGIGDFLSSDKIVTFQNYYMGRIDHQFSESDYFFARYTFDDSARTSPDTLLGPSGVVSKGAARNQYITLEHKHIFSPQLINTARVGFTRVFTPNDTVIPQSLIDTLPKFHPGHDRFGSVELPGTPVLGTDSGKTTGAGNIYQYQDQVVYTRGRHSLKFGGEIQRYLSNTAYEFHKYGKFRFPTVVRLLQGSPDSFDGVTPESDFIRGWRLTLFGFYAQDDIKVGDRLTLNLGLRYEPISNPYEVNGKTSTIENLLTSKTVTVTKNVFEKNPALKNFEPRVGLAWDIFGNGKTALRLGGGIYHDQLMPNVYAITSPTSAPFVEAVKIPNPDFPNPFTKTGTPQELSMSIAQYFDVTTPYSMQWNMMVQQEVLPNTVVGVGYVGSRGVHLNVGRDMNIAQATIRPDGTKFFPVGSKRRNPAFGEIRYADFSADSAYHSLQLSLQRRFGTGLQIQSSYTFSKNLDILSGLNTAEAASGGGGSQRTPQDPDDMSKEWGPSLFHVAHNFVTNYSYILPWGNSLTGWQAGIFQGWQVNGIVSLRSGNPGLLLLGFNNSRNLQISGSLADRPDLKPGYSNNPTKGVTKGCPGVPAGRPLGTPEFFYDPCAFSLPEPGTYGNVGRMTLVGPGYANVDFGLTKNFTVREGQQLSFRTEVFNLFNHPNFRVPAGNRNPVISDSSGFPRADAGRITDTVGTSRQIQFGLKYTF
jgi:hypothetical protein